MDAHATPQPAKPTLDSRVARLFGLTGDNWRRHANPLSVWTRFSVLALLAISIWSRAWIGWWCLAPIALSLVWMFANPLLFPPPRSTANWASRAVFGERIWAERRTADIPSQFRSPVPDVANAIAALGLALAAYGLVVMDVVAVVAGVAITNVSKLWYLDRMVLLFEDMKARDRRFAGWEYR